MTLTQPARPPLVPTRRVIGFAQMHRVKVDGQDVWVMTREELMQFAGKIAATAIKQLRDGVWWWV